MRCLDLVPITAIAVLGSGCAVQGGKAVQVETGPSRQVVEHAPDDVWDAVQEALRREGWRLDRLDREAGAISTLPETSQHFFEIWRKDVNTKRDFWEATMTPVRRWTEIQVTANAEGCEISVIVHKEQLSSPDRQFNSSGTAYQYFGTALPSTTGKRVTAEDDRWMDRGRDTSMERYVLATIMEMLVHSSG